MLPFGVSGSLRKELYWGFDRQKYMDSRRGADKYGAPLESPGFVSKKGYDKFD